MSQKHTKFFFFFFFLSKVFTLFDWPVHILTDSLPKVNWKNGKHEKCRAALPEFVSLKLKEAKDVMYTSLVSVSWCFLFLVTIFSARLSSFLLCLLYVILELSIKMKRYL